MRDAIAPRCPESIPDKEQSGSPFHHVRPKEINP